MPYVEARERRARHTCEEPGEALPRLTGSPVARGGEGTRDAGASLGETASAVPTAGWKYLASEELVPVDGVVPFPVELAEHFERLPHP